MIKKIKYYLIKIQQTIFYYRYKAISPFTGCNFDKHKMKIHFHKTAFNHSGVDMLTYISFHHPIFRYQNKPRIPVGAAQKGTKTLLKNAMFNAGKSIEFYTSSELLGIKVLYKKRAVLNHMKSSEAGGIEVLVHKKGNVTCHMVAPDHYCQMFLKTRVELGLGNKVIHIRFPGYASIDQMELGFTADSSLEACKDAKSSPIVFYGSSITQGCAASRPSLSYVHLVGDLLKKPILNFGFSESAMGEHEVIDYISRQSACIYIIEYDHNVSVERLRDTHLDVYKSIREKNLDIPIIFISRFSGGLSISEDEDDKRIKIISDTIAYARGNHDSKVWFLAGKDVLSGKKKEAYFVDDRHPNDEGMKLMAESLVEIIKKAGNHYD